LIIKLGSNKGIIPFFCFETTWQAGLGKLPPASPPGFVPWEDSANMKAVQSRRLQIVNDLGLHARSAAKLAKLAGEANGGVWIMKNGNTADATSILDILTLACPKGSEITVSIDDKADMITLDRIAVLIRSGFGE
jgi:phosphocarrier protein HPr